MKGRSVAQVVSRALADAGVRPIPSGAGRGREGVHVSGGADDCAYVTVDLDLPTAAKRLCDDVQEILENAAYQVERIRDSGLRVRRAS